MSKPNYVAMCNRMVELVAVFEKLCWENFPVVVLIAKGIPCDLLTLTGDTTVIVSEGVSVGMTVEIRLGLLVLDSYCIVVVDADRLRGHDIIAQRGLKLGGHEVISWPRPR